jgi:heme/copper-type cytochrome/quinol oxidase subunit 2
MWWFWWFVIGALAVLAVIGLVIYTVVKNRKEEKLYEE